MTNRLDDGLGMCHGVDFERIPKGWRRRGWRAALPHPREPGAKNFKIRANKLMEAGIIECSQDLGRCLSAPERKCQGAGYNPGPEAHGT